MYRRQCLYFMLWGLVGVAGMQILTPDAKNPEERKEQIAQEINKTLTQDPKSLVERIEEFTQEAKKAFTPDTKSLAEYMADIVKGGKKTQATTSTEANLPLNLQKPEPPGDLICGEQFWYSSSAAQEIMHQGIEIILSKIPYTHDEAARAERMRSLRGFFAGPAFGIVDPVRVGGRPFCPGIPVMDEERARRVLEYAREMAPQKEEVKNEEQEYSGYTSGLLERRIERRGVNYRSRQRFQPLSAEERQIGRYQP